MFYKTPNEKQMNHLGMIKILLFALVFSASTSAIAQGGRVGERLPEFQLQSTDGQFYGIRYSEELVSVISLVGYD
jgi:hypothetical protein